ncbi:YkvA family protein [Hydrogenophaga sp. T2]|uniref:YkvA family protein n=1 Tax=Hydrogenophaga sp. T2 TaxID=3132823 RepID=UPI003CF68CEE
MGAIARLKQWARGLKRDAMTLWFARRHPQTPWAVKLLVLMVVGYALSPIDLIPDAIPVLGLLDDALLLPLLIALALRLLPPQVLSDARAEADAWQTAGHARPRSRLGAAVIVGLWVLALAGLGWLGWRAWDGAGA